MLLQRPGPINGSHQYYYKPTLTARVNVLVSMPRPVLTTFIVSLWILLVAPLWYFTMATYRAPLDYAQMDTYDKSIDSIVQASVPVYLNVTEEQFPDIQKATKLVADRALVDAGIHNWNLDVRKGADVSALTVNLELGDNIYYNLADDGRVINISYDLEILSAGRLPDIIVMLLLENVFHDELEWFSGRRELSNHVLRYSPNYHITFSLFYGDGDKVEWDFSDAIARFRPLRNALARGVANTTVDSQVEYFAEAGATPRFSEEQQAWILEKSDLATFVNFAEWSLASSINYPTLNFILYIPSKKNAPLLISGSEKNTFLVPQWGGVVILNSHDESRKLTQEDLSPVFDIFASQLLTLLGAPSNPKSPHLRIDSLSRITAARAVRDTAASLGSLHRLAMSMPNIAIPKKVLENTQEALDDISTSIKAMASGAFPAAVYSAGRALGFAERAFFDRHMVSQTFFPDEHKLAVYMPLLGPMLVVLVSGWLRLRLRSRYSSEDKKEIEAANKLAAQHKKLVASTDNPDE